MKTYLSFQKPLGITLCFFTLLWSVRVNAQSVTITEKGTIHLKDQLCFIQFIDGSMDWKKLPLDQDFEQYVKCPEDLEVDSKSSFWTKLELINETAKDEWALEVSKDDLSEFWVVEFDSRKQTWVDRRTGIFTPTSDQEGYFPWRDKYNLIDIHLKPGASTTFLLGFKNERTHGDPDLNLALIPHDSSFYQRLNSGRLALSVVSGIFVLLIIIGLSFFFSTRDKSFLFYSLYLASVLVWVLFSSGFLQGIMMRHVFTDHPQYAYLPFNVVLSYLLYITFLWHFGCFGERLKHGKRFLWIVIAYHVLFFFLLSGTLFWYNFNFQYFFELGIVFNSGVTLISVYLIFALWNRYKEEDMRYVLIGLALLTGIAVIASIEVIRNDFRLPELSFVFILTVSEILLFIYALSIRYKRVLGLKATNDLMSRSLEEKDTLLREIHHRVKNNLQVISALLTLQSHHVKDESAALALRKGQDRVESMALIHKNLYQHDNLKGVDSKDYFERLTQHLLESYQLTHQEVKLELDVDPILLDVDTMIPLGLIVNELISNSLKHGFKEVSQGEIRISLKEADHKLILKVADNGQGNGEVTQKSKGRSFGQSLIRSLSRRLDAEIVVVNSNGYQVNMEIKRYKKAG